MSNINPNTSSEAVVRPNGENIESMFNDAEIILPWGMIELNKEYSLLKSVKSFRYIYFLFSCSASGSLTNSVLFPTQAIGSNGTSANAIILNNLISSTITVYAQVGLPSLTTFKMSYIENKNTNENFKNFYLRIYGIQ